MMVRKPQNMLGLLALFLLLAFQGEKGLALVENYAIPGEPDFCHEAKNKYRSNEDRDWQSSDAFQHPSGLSLNFQFNFGKATYGDSDGNGFDDATILGGGLGVVMDFRGPWSLWGNFNQSNSYDALTVYPGYEILDPSVEADRKGTLTNRMMDGGISYRFNWGGIFDQFQMGIGFLDYHFIAKEHGYLEVRDYSGVEVLFHGEKRFNDRLMLQGNFQLAPALSVADHVKGDYDNPGRTANTSYGAYFWSTKWGMRIMINSQMWLESGFSYQVLHGDGHEHPDYRFLEHQYQQYGFYALFGTRFFGGPNPAKNEARKNESQVPATVAMEPYPTAEQAPVAIATYPAPIVSGVSPGSGFIGTQVDLIIEGKRFRPDSKGVLTAGETVLPLTNVSWTSENQLSGSLDLKNAVPGTYCLKVTNPDGQFGEMANAFVIKPQALPVAPEKEEVSVSTGEGFSNGAVLITFKGTGFVPGTTVKMIGPSGNVVSGEIVKIQSGEMMGFFNLKNQNEGSYDVLISYPDGRSVKLPEGFKIAAFSEKNAQTLMAVYFNVAKATITQTQIGSIKNLLAKLLGNPQARIILGGYTDMRGSVRYNLELSMRRAEAVKSLLIAGGINPERIDIYAYGKEKAKQGSDENVWRNDRRVEIVIYQAN